MKELKIKNYWKTASYLLLGIALFLIVFSIIADKEFASRTADGDVKFPEFFIDEAIEIYKGQEQFVMCSVPDKKCIVFSKAGKIDFEPAEVFVK
jgi:hypothetical protein